jgi:predicted RNase H-like HicB family nuclease
MTTEISTIQAVATTNQDKKRNQNTKADSSTIDLYLARKYPIELLEDDGAFVASNPDLPGCMSFGETPTEAVGNLADVRKLWIEGQLSSGRSIPEPSDTERYSGKFVFRIPKLLHRQADFVARQQGVSLNALLSNIVAGALGFSPYEGSAGSSKAGSWDNPIFWHRHCETNVGWKVIYEDVGVGHVSLGHLKTIANLIPNSFDSPLKLQGNEDNFRAEKEKH